MTECHPVLSFLFTLTPLQFLSTFPPDPLIALKLALTANPSSLPPSSSSLHQVLLSSRALKAFSSAVNGWTRPLQMERAKRQHSCSGFPSISLTVQCGTNLIHSDFYCKTSAVGITLQVEATQNPSSKVPCVCSLFPKKCKHTKEQLEPDVLKWLIYQWQKSGCFSILR